jgi:hypothetical protein
MAETPKERRRHARSPVQFPVTCLVRVPGAAQAGPPLAGRLRNVSVGGALLELPACVPPGGTVAMGVPTKTGSVEVEGRVIWVTAGAGTGGGQTYVHGVQLSTMEGKPDPVLAHLCSYAAGAPFEGDRPPDT